MPKLVLSLLALFLLFAPGLVSAAPFQTNPTSPSISGVVQDETGQPVAAVAVTLYRDALIQQTLTNELGKFHFDAILPGDYRLNFEKSGFFKLSGYEVHVLPVSAELELTLSHEYEMHSELDVVASPHEIDPQQTEHQEEIVAKEIRDDPTPSSHTLQDSLPAVPGVVQDNTGQLHVAGSRIEDSLYLLDGFQINNPATGLFDARVNVDTVRAVDVSSGRYGAQFANAGSSVLALQTDTGDDHWRFGTTNFPPSLSFQQGIHLGNWFPRVTFSGPLQKGRAWFSDGASLQHSFTLVPELPAGSNTAQDWSADNLIRLQYNLSPSQSLQANVLYNGDSGNRTGLGPLAPASTTTNLYDRRLLISVKGQVVLNRGLFEVGIASDWGRLDRTPQGSETYVLTPTGPTGNYFERLSQNDHRWQGRGDLTLTDLYWHGAQKIQIGFNLAQSHLDQTAYRSPIEIQSANAVVRTSTFVGNAQPSASESQIGVYLQDSWQVLHPLTLQTSFRVDRNDFIRRTLPQPRLVLNWSPQVSTKFSLGWGLYYQPIYLSPIAQSNDQQRLDVFPSAPAIVTSFSIGPALHQPFFQNISAEWQQQISTRTITSVSLMQRQQHDGLAYENVSADPAFQQLQLRNSRRERYQAFDTQVRRSLRDGSDVMIDYTYSQSHSNKIFDYAVDNLTLAPQAAGPLTWDAPHRVISRGSLQTGVWNLLFSYFAEYHTGFPFSAVNSEYRLAGIPNGYRYPAYFDLNVGAEKRISFLGNQWAVRLSVINITGHNNYDSVINNVDAANFGTFMGGQHRALTARLRLVGRK